MERISLTCTDHMFLVCMACMVVGFLISPECLRTDNPPPPTHHPPQQRRIKVYDCVYIIYIKNTFIFILTTCSKSAPMIEHFHFHVDDAFEVFANDVFGLPLFQKIMFNYDLHVYSYSCMDTESELKNYDYMYMYGYYIINHPHPSICDSCDSRFVRITWCGESWLAWRCLWFLFVCLLVCLFVEVVGWLGFFFWRGGCLFFYGSIRDSVCDKAGNSSSDLIRSSYQSSCLFRFVLRCLKCRRVPAGGFCLQKNKKKKGSRKEDYFVDWGGWR